MNLLQGKLIQFKCEYKVNGVSKSVLSGCDGDVITTEDHLSSWINPYLKGEITDLKIWNLTSGLFLDYSKV